jgi:hypothetical protein
MEPVEGSERIDTILESLVDLGTLHREHQGLLTEKNEEGRTFCKSSAMVRTSHPAIIKFVAGKLVESLKRTLLPPLQAFRALGLDLPS